MCIRDRYLLTYGNGVLVDTLVRLYKLCDAEICNYPVYTMADKESTGFVIRECLIANLKVLINLTHDFNNRCKYVCRVHVIQNTEV